MPGGRPTKYSKELANLICERLAMGESLRTVCKSDDMPSPASVFNWLRDHKEFLEQYDIAKQEATDAMAEDILDIADNGSNDYMETDDGKVIYQGDSVQRSRLRVDTRKWLMSKMKPKKYGDKIDMTSNGKDIVIPILGGTAKADNVHTDDSDQEAS